MEYNNFKLGYLDQCAQVFMQAFNSLVYHEQWNIESSRNRLMEILRTPGFCGIVAIEGGECLGFAMGYGECWHNGKVFYLKEMCVCPDKQRSGIGRKIVEALADRLKDSDINSMHLLTVKDSLAEEFYEKIGFVVNQRKIMMERVFS